MPTPRSRILAGTLARAQFSHIPGISRTRHFQLHIRSMTTAREYEWLVVIPDAPGMLAKRLEVRSKHFEKVNAREKNGQWKMGGAILGDVPESDDPTKLKFVGSTLIVLAATKDDVMAQLKEDIYATSGVWDLDKVQLWPLKTAFRNP